MAFLAEQLWVVQERRFDVFFFPAHKTEGSEQLHETDTFPLLPRHAPRPHPLTTTTQLHTALNPSIPPLPNPLRNMSSPRPQGASADGRFKGSSSTSGPPRGRPRFSVTPAVTRRQSAPPSAGRDSDKDNHRPESRRPKGKGPKHRSASVGAGLSRGSSAQVRGMHFLVSQVEHRMLRAFPWQRKVSIRRTLCSTHVCAPSLGVLNPTEQKISAWSTARLFSAFLLVLLFFLVVLSPTKRIGRNMNHIRASTALWATYLGHSLLSRSTFPLQSCPGAMEDLTRHESKRTRASPQAVCVSSKLYFDTLLLYTLLL